MKELQFWIRRRAGVACKDFQTFASVKGLAQSPWRVPAGEASSSGTALARGRAKKPCNNHAKPWQKHPIYAWPLTLMSLAVWLSGYRHDTKPDFLRPVPSVDFQKPKRFPHCLPWKQTACRTSITGKWIFGTWKHNSLNSPNAVISKNRMLTIRYKRKRTIRRTWQRWMNASGQVLLLPESCKRSLMKKYQKAKNPMQV